MPVITEPNWITLEGAVNVRDCGGMPARTGHTRPGILLRGDNMANLTAGDIARLTGDYRLARLIDLRSPMELAASGPSPLRDAGVAIDHLPVLSDEDLARRRRTAHERLALDPEAPFASGYEEYLSLGLAAIGRAFAVLAADDGLPALVHCTAGRDRTGALIAILLDAAGVDRAWIVADYAATAQRAAALADRLAAMSGREQQAAMLTADRLATHPHTMEALLALIDADHGGTHGLLRAAGADDAAIARWQRILIDPA